MEIKTAIKSMSKYIKQVDGTIFTLKQGTLILKHDTTIINNNDLIQNNNNISVTGTVQNKVAEKSFTFTVKIVNISQQRIDNAIAKLKTIDNQEVKILASASINELKTEIRKLQIFQEVIAMQLKLENEELVLKKDHTFYTTIINDDIVTVKRTITSTDYKKKADFTFNIKVKFCTDQDLFNDALKRLNLLRNQEIKICLPATISKVEREIKNFMQDFENRLAPSIKLEENEITLEKNYQSTIAENDIFTVKGVIKLNKQKENFTFTVKVKFYTTQKRKQALENFEFPSF